MADVGKEQNVQVFPEEGKVGKVVEDGEQEEGEEAESEPDEERQHATVQGEADVPAVDVLGVLKQVHPAAILDGHILHLFTLFNHENHELPEAFPMNPPLDGTTSLTMMPPPCDLRR